MEIKHVPLESVWKMRFEIMYPEHSIEMVKLPADEQGLHYGLYEGDILMSVISLFVEEGKMQFRKFCTRVDQQGKGYGTTLLRHVFDVVLPAHQVAAIWCNARTNAAALYERFGMVRTERTYRQYGYDFVIMEKLLAA
ncbi:hypothetical protein BFP72_01070 [Reichenbachiella sp. 5M10]|uniref:GNAT family N-acetyltransferase n=1 Tax=Reichenbachiella sp. 5M10 TaxID=1889772 RepID=UPI000C437917|nr:GNAT family N-acetyltransferase [Reichenbachiella sp. 5M10]PIB34115.1 hypothetical protein BFP72_01070 [Reichenbachiella sp. 5M10]